VTEDRSGRLIPFPPVGYSFPYAPKFELPRPDYNTRLLTRLAQATGGEINPKSLEKLQINNISKNQQPLRQGLITIAFGLFLLEVALRKLIFAEPD
jgi:hypothetical protein